jgi:hypothetical protein
MNNFGRYPRREIAMPCPAQTRTAEIGWPALPAAFLPRRDAFRSVLGLIICRHLIMGFD